MKLLLAYAGSVLLSVSSTTFVKLGGGKTTPVTFNINKSLSAALMFLIIGLFTNMFPINTPTLLFGIAYGVLFATSMWLGLKAFVAGPLALTSMIISFSLLIPYTYGIVSGDEITLLSVAGIVLLIASFIFINIKKSGKEPGKGVSAKWLLLTVGTLVCDGCCAIIKKEHQKMFPNQYKTEIMFVALGCASILFILAYFAKGEFKDRKNPIDIWGILAGITNGGGSYLSLYLVAVEDISVQAPVLAALTSVAALASGKFIFKEKLSVNQLIGFALGVASVVLLKL